MFEIHFYKDDRGNEPVFEYIKNLQGRTDKDSRIKRKKINDYIELLSLHGKALGEPFIKHLRGDIWELRPLRNRILFATWIDGGFILLHVFEKKTKKTPPSEIKQAERNLIDFTERSKEHEK